ncbi:hypothetical protein Pint_31456 [Pistacia integerrima]|uniref:Uncharacterized protein n=1 Tax=Pistacia integerrima TaxID=434235 RepID=A0ACC0XRM6_9ROSI|nr:hypothetical protein Pint_31456 [Pistacia integerrima]
MYKASNHRVSINSSLFPPKNLKLKHISMILENRNIQRYLHKNNP